MTHGVLDGFHIRHDRLCQIRHIMSGKIRKRQPVQPVRDLDPQVCALPVCGVVHAVIFDKHEYQDHHKDHYGQNNIECRRPVVAKDKIIDHKQEQTRRCIGRQRDKK